MRGVAVIGATTSVLMALAYLSSLAGVAVPTGALFAVGFPALLLTSVAYILLLRSPSPADAPGLRWWMPVVWVALVINDGIVWRLAHRATSGGHVEGRAGRSVLVVYGRVIRELDQRGVHAVAVWDARLTSSHMLVMLAFASLGLVGMLDRRRREDSPSPTL